jgi:hypothetical protein
MDNKVKCACGCYVSLSSLYMHEKSKKHQIFLQLENINDKLIEKLVEKQNEILELKDDNNKLLDRILNERVEKINLEFVLDELKKKYC